MANTGLVPTSIDRVPTRWQRVSWSLPWLLFQFFPVVDLITVPRPWPLRVLIGLALVAFTAAYLSVLSQVAGPRRVRWDFLVVALLAVLLGVALGVGYAGLMIYVSAAAAATLPDRWIWPVTAAAASVSAGVIVVAGEWSLLFLPVLCLLTAFALRGTRYLISVNAELREAREELAANAVAQERLRFARDLHDLLGQSLSLIALKSELAGRLAEADPARARREMADVEAAARRALAEVRDAVSGYRQVSCAQALAEARAALSGAGIAFHGPPRIPALPGTVDAALGWVIREATTNVLRHSRAAAMTVTLNEHRGAVRLTVTDDGRGPDADTAPGSGLTGLAERVEALAGRLTGGAAPGGGWQLVAEVPLAAADEPVTA